MENACTRAGQRTTSVRGRETPHSDANADVQAHAPGRTTGRDQSTAAPPGSWRWGLKEIKLTVLIIKWDVRACQFLSCTDFETSEDTAVSSDLPSVHGEGADCPSQIVPFLFIIAFHCHCSPKRSPRRNRPPGIDGVCSSHFRLLITQYRLTTAVHGIYPITG